MNSKERAMLFALQHVIDTILKEAQHNVIVRMQLLGNSNVMDAISDFKVARETYLLPKDM